MTEPDVRLSLTYAAFSQLWKQLVSRRKARKQSLDKDMVWAQLVHKGALAELDENASSSDSVDDATARAGSQPNPAKKPRAARAARTPKLATKAKAKPVVANRPASKPTGSAKKRGATATTRKRTAKSTRR